MKPRDAAEKTAGRIGDLPAQFMLDSETYTQSSDLGFEGIDFYFTGRGGALGSVDGNVVAAAFVFFNPQTVCESWKRGTAVIAPDKAAHTFASFCHSWARDHLADESENGRIDYARIAELTGKVISNADAAGAPVFAGWRALPEPDDSKELALHRLNALRELRGALHGASVITHGLRPVEALMVKTPFMAALFGWNEDLPDAEQFRSRWEAAESSTNEMMGRALSVLDSDELDELVLLLRGVAFS
ncbi:MAG TPA: hypothetical protein VEJ87_16865 [Acidimicrobiales bacterium]|nr:hypothetical protein [Acidimicrobiales bacterium]